MIGNRKKILIVSLASLVLCSTLFARSMVSTLPRIHREVVVLEFWANWCESCHTHASWFDKLSRKYRAFQWIGVAQDESVAESILFIQKHRPSYTQVFDRNHKIANRFQLKAMPAVVILNRQGKVIARFFGLSESTRKKIEKTLANLKRR